MKTDKIRGMGEYSPIPIRIKEAREYCRYSTTELADRIDKTRQAVSQFENGTTKPTPEILSRIADATNFPIEYFFKPPRPQNATMSQIPLYRGSPSKTESLKRAYEITTEWSSDIIDYLKVYVALLDVNLPKDLEFDPFSNVDLQLRIESIAERLRTHWNLGKSPIRDLVGVLENNGFIISKIPNKTKEVEAFSLWADGRPHIFYEGNRDTPTSYVFSICHELGHLVLHASMQKDELLARNTYKDIEQQANLFAGAFLMPAETFGSEYITSNLNSFIQIKKKWGVSLAAMIMRANALGIIDDQQKSYLYRQLSYRGYRKHEPFDDEIAFYEPAIIFNSIKLLLENKIITFQDFMHDIAIPKDALTAICSLPDNFIEKHLAPVRKTPYLQLIK